MKLLWLVVILTLLPLVAPQVGECPQSEVDAFVGSLPNAPGCGLGLLVSFIPGQSTPAELQAAVEAMCQENCGGAVAEFYIQKCNSLSSALFIAGSCLRTGNKDPGADRCRYAGADFIPDMMIDNLAACSSFDKDANMCPENCSESLEAFATLTGCCYQSAYNSTDTLMAYVSLGVISEDQAEYVANISNSALWSACGVDLQSPCSTDDIFSGEMDLQLGNCTAEDLEKIPISGGCSEDFVDVFFRAEPNAIDDVCTPECTGVIDEFQISTCSSPLTSLIYRELCRPTDDASRGDRCYFVVGEQLRNSPVFMNTGVCLVSFGDTENCPDGCASALTELSDQLGCCYQSYYNDTQLLDYFLYEGALSVEERLFFEGLRQPSIWERCDVPILPKCTMSPYGGSVKFAASTIVVFLSIWFSLM